MTPTTDAKGASMQEIPARAALVSAANVGAGLTTSVSREEAEEAIAADGQLELILDVTRFSDGEPAETRSVAVAWERSDLRQLLSQTEGDRVTLTFDGETLGRAMVDDVEAHGVREKAVVLAVAATAVAGVTAGAASGSLGADDRAIPRSAPAPQPSLGPDDRALPRMMPEPEVGPDDRALPRMTPEPELGPDDRALPRMTPVPEPTLGPDDRAVPRTDPLAQPSLSPDDRNLPLGPPVSQPEPVAATSDDGTWFEAPSPETIAVVGGIALAITGAAFAAATASRRRVRPT
jgi:hypothetical protein